MRGSSTRPPLSKPAQTLSSRSTSTVITALPGRPREITSTDPSSRTVTSAPEVVPSTPPPGSAHAARQLEPGRRPPDHLGLTTGDDAHDAIGQDQLEGRALAAQRPDDRFIEPGDDLKTTSRQAHHCAAHRQDHRGADRRMTGSLFLARNHALRERQHRAAGQANHTVLADQPRLAARGVGRQRDEWQRCGELAGRGAAGLEEVTRLGDQQHLATVRQDRLHGVAGEPVGAGQALERSSVEP